MPPWRREVRTARTGGAGPPARTRVRRRARRTRPRGPSGAAPAAIETRVPGRSAGSRSGRGSGTPGRHADGRRANGGQTRGHILPHKQIRCHGLASPHGLLQDRLNATDEALRTPELAELRRSRISARRRPTSRRMTIRGISRNGSVVGEARLQHVHGAGDAEQGLAHLVRHATPASPWRRASRAGRSPPLDRARDVPAPPPPRARPRRPPLPTGLCGHVSSRARFRARRAPGAGDAGARRPGWRHQRTAAIAQGSLGARVHGLPFIRLRQRRVGLGRRAAGLARAAPRQPGHRPRAPWRLDGLGVCRQSSAARRSGSSDARSSRRSLGHALPPALARLAQRSSMRKRAFEGRVPLIEAAIFAAVRRRLWPRPRWRRSARPAGTRGAAALAAVCVWRRKRLPARPSRPRAPGFGMRGSPPAAACSALGPGEAQLGSSSRRASSRRAHCMVHAGHAPRRLVALCPASGEAPALSRAWSVRGAERRFDLCSRATAPPAPAPCIERRGQEVAARSAFSRAARAQRIARSSRRASGVRALPDSEDVVARAVHAARRGPRARRRRTQSLAWSRSGSRPRSRTCPGDAQVPGNAQRGGTPRARREAASRR